MKYFVLLIFGLLCCISSVFSQVSIDSLKKDLFFLASDSLEGRYPGTKSMEMATDYLVAKFNDIGLKPISNTFIQEFPLAPFWGRNIIGIIEGNDSVLKDEYIVLGAHYDHLGWDYIVLGVHYDHLGWDYKNNQKRVYNGADDNASGITALMEVARNILHNKELLKRSIMIVAFDAEEKGLLGSKYFIKNPLVELEKIKIMLSVDMIGMYSFTKQLTFSGCASFEGGTDFLKNVKQVDSINIKYLDYSSMWKDRTDTKHFYDNKIPSMYVSTGLTPYYHKYSDDAELIDFVGLSKISEQLVNISIELSNKESFEFSRTYELIRFIPDEYKIGMTLNMNTNHHIYSEGPYIAKDLNGFGAGLITQFAFNNYFLLQPEISYQYFGSESAEGKIRLHSIDLPMSFVLSSPNDVFKFNLSLGGYINYAFAGKIGEKQIDWNENKFNQIDYGILAGFGYDFYNIQVSFIFRNGYSDFFKESNKAIGKTTNNNFLLKIGYFFLP
jgi:hypothetical protein